jgi:ADP-ribose pyrophosphatase YjhB (NUDIX family)
MTAVGPASSALARGADRSYSARMSAAGPRLRVIPEGDQRERLTCPDCGFIAYENPKVVVGAVVTHGDRFLLCRRAIEPRRGFWTLPAGYLELGETPEEGARREAREEACAEIELDALLGLYTIARKSQVQLIYRARLVHPEVAAGPESEAVALLRWEEIPWDELAFPSVRWALEHHEEVRGLAVFAPRGNPPGALGRLEELPPGPPR